MGAPPLSQKPGNMRSRGDRYEPSFRRCPRWSIGLGWLGILVAFGAVLPRIVWTFDDFWSAMQVLAGIVTFVVGMCLTPCGQPPRGERWTKIGGAEE
jgi:hypothetical protein